MTAEPITFRVVNLRVEKADIRVCRPSRWGNPWRIQRVGRPPMESYRCWRSERLSAVRRLKWVSEARFSQREAHVFAVQEYHSWILEHPELVTALLLKINEHGARSGWTYRDHPGVVTLGCWCVPLPCHANILGKLLTERLLTK
jgi:hypothetical protein